MQLSLQLHLQFKERPVEFARVNLPVDAGNLPKDRLVLFGIGPQDLRIDPSRSVDEDVQAGFAYLVANLIDDVVGAVAVVGGDHHMRHPEVTVGGQGRAQARRSQPLRP